MNGVQQVPNRIANILINAFERRCCAACWPRIHHGWPRRRRLPLFCMTFEMIEDGSASFRFICGQIWQRQELFTSDDSELRHSKRVCGGGCGLVSRTAFRRNQGPGAGHLQGIDTKPFHQIKTGWRSPSLDPGKVDFRHSGGREAQTDESGDAFNQLVERQIFAVAGSLEGMVNGFEFAKAVVTYWKATIRMMPP